MTQRSLSFDRAASFCDATRALRDLGATVEVVICAIDRSPEGTNPLADVDLDVRPVLTKAQLDAVTAR